jgi:radical SAM protein with 4Fe4S-binding SPASM domain
MIKVSSDVCYLIEKLRKGSFGEEFEAITNTRDLYHVLENLNRLVLCSFAQEDTNVCIQTKTSDYLYADLQYPTFRLYLSNLCTQASDYRHIDSAANGEDSKMSWQVAKEAIDGIFNLVAKHNIKMIGIIFYGVETSTEFLILEKIVKYIKVCNVKMCNLDYTLSNNGTIITEQIATFFTENQINVHIDLDGIIPEANISRKLKRRQTSLNAVLYNLDLLLVNGCRVQLNYCLTLANAEKLKELVDFAIKKRIGIIRITLADWSNINFVAIEHFSRVISDAYKYGIHHRIMIQGSWFESFMNLFSSNSFRKNYRHHLHNFCISPSGKISTLVYPDIHIGRVNQLQNVLSLDIFHQICKEWEKEQDSCNRCDIKGACNAQCKMNAMNCNLGKKGYKRECDLLKKVIDNLLADDTLWKKAENGYDFSHASNIEFGYGQNAEWIMAPGYLTEVVNKCHSEDNVIILCSVPDNMPVKKEEYSMMQLQFLEAVELMKLCNCTIISAGTEGQMNEQCKAGYRILKENGIWESKKYLNLNRFWYKKDYNGEIIRGARSAQRVVDAIKSQLNEIKGIYFIIRPGSLRIGDSVARLLLESYDIQKIYVLDTESPIDSIRSEALRRWKRNDKEYKYFSGNIFISLKNDEIKKIVCNYSIGLICIAESYNFLGYPTLLGEVVKKIESVLPSEHRIWIALPGNNGNEYKVKELIELGLKKTIHYTIVLDKLDNNVVNA